ncbi:MAG: ParB/Srx family N-terminal domain-containing protein [Peptococcaceae bacterium]|nr:ParB/Srx family N-terminal domain-containing protein [Peptococcaceae bacterium]
MAIKDFYSLKHVSIAELLLDTGNPRMRNAADQKECISRFLRKPKPFISLIRDIALNGLSIEHILVSRNKDNKWVVRDGNRRVAALKLLNEPELCPDQVLRQEIKRLASENPENVLTHVDCITSDNEEAILRYIDLKHSGEKGGVGQVSWSALTKAIFNVIHGYPDQNKRAVQLIFWAEENGIRIEDEFPLTNLNRMLNQKTLELIGFKVENDILIPIIDIESARKMVDSIITDLVTNAVSVDNIYTPEQQLEYVKNVRNEVLPEEPDTNKGGNTYEHLDKTDKMNGATDKTSKDKNQTQIHSDTTLNDLNSVPYEKTRSPRKPSWDRKCIFPGKRLGFTIPEENIKANNIVVELKELDVRKTPIAVAILFRALIELSEAYYRNRNGLPYKDAFHKNIASIAEHMAKSGEITEDQKEVIMRRTRNVEDILHITTLHKYVHSPNFHPTYQIINTMWDEFGFLIKKCWKT